MHLNNTKKKTHKKTQYCCLNRYFLNVEQWKKELSIQHIHLLIYFRKPKEAFFVLKSLNSSYSKNRKIDGSFFNDTGKIMCEIAKIIQKNIYKKNPQFIIPMCFAFLLVKKNFMVLFGELWKKVMNHTSTEMSNNLFIY